MAKTTVTVAVFIFLSAVAQARFSLDLTANKAVTTVSEGSETKLLLPTEKPETESESKAVVAWEPEIFNPKHANSESDTDGQDFKSMTVISVRPIKRGGSHKHPFHDFHRSKRVRGGKVTGYRKNKVSAEGRKRTRSASGNRQRQFPGRLMRLRNPGLKRETVNGLDMKKRHRNNRHRNGKVEARHHVPDHKHVHVHEHEQKQKQKRASGFVRKIRKFLMSF